MQLLNAHMPIEVEAIVDGITIAVRAVHWEKQLNPIEVTPSWMVTVVKLEQLEKAEFPIVLTPLGITIEAKDKQ